MVPNPEAEPDLSAMLQDEHEDYLKQLKRRSKQKGTKEEDKDDAMSDEEDEEEAANHGDPVESKSAFKAYMLNVLTSNELD